MWPSLVSPLRIWQLTDILDDNYNPKEAVQRTHHYPFQSTGRAVTQLIWFRNDLRLADNPALTAAMHQGEKVEACFLPTPDQWQEHDWSPARTDLMLRSLDRLAADLASLGIPLHIRTLARFADTDDALLELCRETGAQGVHCNEEYAVNERNRDHRLKHWLEPSGIRLHIYRDQTVVPVRALYTGGGTPYTVFTPYSRRWWQWIDENPPKLHPSPAPQAEPVERPAIPELDDWRTEKAHWAAPGETAGHEQLERFLQERMAAYGDNRDFPALDGTSVISPYLALGVLSPRQCVIKGLEAIRESRRPEAGRTWLNEIAWRDFYIQLMVHFPRLSKHRPFKTETEALVWNEPGEAFDAWCEGRIGIPIVDAAMRQLNETGWMHNRLRMVTAMFLTKNLFIDWREGERYFMRSLVDGYLPSNNGGWQWSASTGTDAAPYFRIFNPVTQSERFDPEGVFIRRYVPEIGHLEGKALFNPNGKVSGYPGPIVYLKSSRKEAIAKFQALSK